MSRRKPPRRAIPERSRNNPKRRLRAVVPNTGERVELGNRANYGPYSKHKFHPHVYGLSAYMGQDDERTYCDAHAQFKPEDCARIPLLLRRGIGLGLWSERGDEDGPALLWTIDDNGWIFELRVTNAGLAQYHGYPVVPGDAFALHVLTRAREVAFAGGDFQIQDDPNLASAVAAAEAFYR